ncbi:unnamed protein product [Sphagnum balticum]
MSASRLEAFWECPYKFFSRTYLNLFDEDDLEIEPSPQAKGQWLHSAAEKILKSDKALSQWTSDDLSQLVDSLDQVQQKISSDIWKNIRSRFVRQLHHFVKSEMEWARQFPKSRPVAFEAPIQGVLSWMPLKSSQRDEETSPVSLSNVKSGEFWVKFQGSVDRVDLTEDGRALIVDYKSGSASSRHISTWNKNGSFQLTLYSAALEAGLVLGYQNLKVVAAQYYVLKNMKRDRGFWNVDENLEGILPLARSQSAISRAEQEKYFGEIQESVQMILEQIRSGVFTPEPRDTKVCSHCSSRLSCRAKHLL